MGNVSSETAVGTPTIRKISRRRERTKRTRSGIIGTTVNQAGIKIPLLQVRAKVKVKVKEKAVAVDEAKAKEKEKGQEEEKEILIPSKPGKSRPASTIIPKAEEEASREVEAAAAGDPGGASGVRTHGSQIVQQETRPDFAITGGTDCNARTVEHADILTTSRSSMRTAICAQLML